MLAFILTLYTRKEGEGEGGGRWRGSGQRMTLKRLISEMSCCIWSDELGAGRRRRRDSCKLKR